MLDPFDYYLQDERPCQPEIIQGNIIAQGSFRHNVNYVQESKGKGIIQVGIYVKNVEETARELEQLLRIGPFMIFEPEYRDLVYRGKVGNSRVKICLATVGSIQIELAQSLFGETIYDDFAKGKGYRLHHLGIRTDSLEDDVRKMEKKGFRVIQSRKTS